MANNWIYVDEWERVLGSNPNDMTGNSGWHGVTGAVPDPLLSMDGVPLYKLVGDTVVARSAEEIAADTPLAHSVPTRDERLEAVEAAVLEMLLGGMGDG